MCFIFLFFKLNTYMRTYACMYVFHISRAFVLQICFLVHIKNSFILKCKHDFMFTFMFNGWSSNRVKSGKNEKLLAGHKHNISTNYIVYALNCTYIPLHVQASGQLNFIQKNEMKTNKHSHSHSQDQ